MDELYQAEWCPHSRRVRQRLTELGVPFIARQVPADPAAREEMRRKTGSDEIPALLLEDGTAVTGEADELIAWLNERHAERADAEQHREKAAQLGVPGAEWGSASEPPHPPMLAKAPQQITIAAHVLRLTCRT